MVFEGDARPAVRLTAEAGGYFSGIAPAGRAGDLYRFRLDDEKSLFPDPASRFQPDGPHGPSQVIDPKSFAWTDSGWKGVAAAGQVLYEMHVGTFTREGTWAAAERELPELARIGVTCLEVMPVAEFPGTFGWGYDGVDLFAPTRLYGKPDDFRRFVNRAHELGVGVILDVVYNHVGPDGNYLGAFSSDYFTTRHKTDWGEAINFDGEHCEPVREFYLANARYWIEEYHLDGYRFDATQNIYDDSKDHILAAITREARRAGGGKSIYLIAENEPQHTRIVRPPEAGGYGMDGLWNDDFHHSAIVCIDAHHEAYFSDYRGNPQEFVSAAKYGYLFQGQHYTWQKSRRGSPGLELPPTAFVHFLENHDQVANLPRGRRVHQMTSPGEFRAMTTLMLLGPQTPMLFQGQEFASSKPFYYFADHNPELARLVAKGRFEFMGQFPRARRPEMREYHPEPSDRSTFDACRLDLNERELHGEAYALHRDLLRLRREDAVLRDCAAGQHGPGRIDGAVLGPRSFVLRFFGPGADDRLLIVNLGADQDLDPLPEPLLAPPLDSRWELVFSSEDPRYGGAGTVPPESEQGWFIPGRAAVLLRPVPDAPAHASPEGQP